MRSTASSISSWVFSNDRLKRTDDETTSGGQPIATRAGDGSVEPLAQVLPSEQEMPARSSATNSASPSTPGNAMLSVLGNRWAEDPFTTTQFIPDTAQAVLR